MALVACRECGREVSDAAESCPHCGIAAPGGAAGAPAQAAGAGDATAPPKRGRPILRGVLQGLAIVAIAVIVMGLLGANAPVCRVASVEGAPEIFLTGDEPDYGAVVTVVVQNEGRAQDVTVEAGLETDAGDFTKTMEVSLDEDGERELRFPFPEPTITTEMQRVTARCL